MAATVLTEGERSEADQTRLEGERSEADQTRPEGEQSKADQTRPEGEQSKADQTGLASPIRVSFAPEPVPMPHDLLRPVLWLIPRDRAGEV